MAKVAAKPRKKPAKNKRSGKVKLDPATNPDLRGNQSLYRTEYCETAREMVANGATTYDLASAFGVNQKTIYNWAVKHSEFSAALKVGHALATDRVEHALYHKAVGYTYPAVKIMAVAGEVRHEVYEEHVPPDVAAAKFWLVNRRGEMWTDKQANELSGPGGKPIETKEVSDLEYARRIAFALAKATAMDLDHDDNAA